MLRLRFNGDGTSASLVNEDGVAVADGEVRPSDGAEFLVNATPDGGVVSLELRFVGKVVNS